MGDIRTLSVASLRARFKLEAFCESGTLYGDAVEFARQLGFEEIHSIEIMRTLWEKAKERFRNNENVYIHLGDSVSVLTNLTKSINRPTLFWLDAHFPGADSHERAYDAESNAALRVPLTLETQLIASRCHQWQDVIVIDDLWMYEDGPFEWGSFDEHNRKCGRSITRAQVVSGSLESVYEAFAATHNFTKLYHHQGYLIFTPR